MKDFSVRQMRSEYRGVLRLIVGAFVSVLLAASLMGALLAARHAESAVMLTSGALLLVLCLAALGAYLILSDEKHLIRRTPFGQALTRLGDARSVMREIDQSAMQRCERRGAYALLKDWLIIYRLDGWRMDRRRVCACPVPRGSIRAILVLPERNPDDPQERRVLVTGDNGVQYSFSCFQQQDVDALRNWMRGEEP